MASSKSSKGRYNFLIDSSVYESFSELCDELGLVRSKKLEIYMKEFIEKNREMMKKSREVVKPGRA